MTENELKGIPLSTLFGQKSDYTSGTEESSVKDFFAQVKMEDLDGPIVIENRQFKDSLVCYYQLKGGRYFYGVAFARKDNSFFVESVWTEPYFRVYVRITSIALAPDDITKLLEIEPTWSGVMGTPRLNMSLVKCKEHEWQLDIRKNSPASAEEKIVEALEIFDKRKNALRQVLQNSSADIVLAIYGQNGQIGGFSIASGQMEELAKLGFGIETDIYSS